MDCPITIDPPVVLSADGNTISEVDVSGTASPDCTYVDIYLTCSGSTVGPHQIVQVHADGQWTATFADPAASGCVACGGRMSIVAQCAKELQCTPVSRDGDFPCVPDQACPNINVAATVYNCTADGGRVVSFFVTVTAPAGASVIWHLDYGDGTVGQPHVTASGTFSYYDNHTYHIQPTGIPAVVVDSPSNCESVSLDKALPDLGGCIACPVAANLVVTPLAWCTSDGKRLIQLSVQLTGMGQTDVQIDWGDGSALEVTNGVAVGTHTWTHPYDPGNSRTIAVTIPGCVKALADTGQINPCNGGNNKPPQKGKGGGGGCTGLRIAIIILLAASAFVLAYWACVPEAGASLGLVAAGIAVAAAALLIVYKFVCPHKPCAWWQLMSWQATLGAALACLYFTTCCPLLWAVSAALGLTATGFFVYWVKKCHPSKCRIIGEITFVVSTLMVPVLEKIGYLPGLANCGNSIVVITVSVAAAIIGISAAICLTPDA